jgi:cysteine-rich repeat protein
VRLGLLALGAVLLLGACGDNGREVMEGDAAVDGRVGGGEAGTDGGDAGDGARPGDDGGRTGCGDGVMDPGEACDDGDANSDTEPDACRTDCTAARCGDGVGDTGETCDTGDARSDTMPDACRIACVVPSCGDSVTDTGEGCDDGNDVDTDACRNDCSLPTCGDMVLDPGEECDDGDRDDGDGCQGNCLLPVCGDRIVDPGEECDDGNRLDGDGCQADCTRSECIRSEECTDGLFCNGPEVCTAGVCGPGTPPALGDGVACTVDSCDESADTVVHRPDDAMCPTGPLRCATAGARAGMLVRDSGRCDATAGCGSVETLADDCLDDGRYPTTFSCSGSELHRHEGVCLAAGGGLPARCGMSDVVQRDCRDAIPMPHPFCSGSAAGGDLTWHHTAVPICAASPPSCSFSESTTRCTAPGPSCLRGTRTTSTPTCSNPSGCSTSTSSMSCPDSPSRCETPAGAPLTLVTYTPACASPTTCGSPTENRTFCTRPPDSCEGRVFTAWSATCNATTESCGRTPLREVDCAARDSCGMAINVGSGCIQPFTVGVCDPATGCSTMSDSIFCMSPLRCRCVAGAASCF